MSERWEPTPIPSGDGRHDIGDETRAAIVNRLMDDWRHDPDLSQEKVRQLAMWAGASIRALLHELGTLRDFAVVGSAPPSLSEASGSTGRSESAQDNSRWQSIETAPKDGTLVWLAYQARKGPFVITGSFRENRGWWWTDVGNVEPTHWMRYTMPKHPSLLPSPPSEEK